MCQAAGVLYWQDVEIYAMDKHLGIHRAELASSFLSVYNPLLVSSLQLALTVSITHSKTLIRYKNKKYVLFHFIHSSS